MRKILLAIIFVMAASYLAAEDKKLFDFAGSLYSSGDYYRAIGEYKRYIFYNPAGRFAEKAAVRIILSYLSAEKWDGAIEAFEHQAVEYSPEFKNYTMILAGYAYASKKDFAYSESLLARAAAGSGTAGLVEKALYLQAYNRVYMKKWAEAGEYFGKISADTDLKKSALAVSALMNKSGDIQERSAVISALCSAVLPGGGYYYCGRFADGALATVFNGIFIYNTYNAFTKNDAVMKLVYGIPAVVLYLANIYGGAVAAGKFNDDEIAKFIRAADDNKADILSVEF